MSLTIRSLESSDARACDAIVASLPYHFGLEEGRVECAAAVRSQPGLVAERDGEVIGFLTTQHRFDDAAEITWMAVHADHRHGGVGRALMDRLASGLEAEGRRLLLVLTVSPHDPPDDSGHEADGYTATRAFYAANGFALARDFAGYWGDHDTPVLMVRTLGG
jgi:ribosomal protein S18 acetylase RimI-like enzyme